MKKTNITLSIALAAIFSASTAFAEAEVSGKIVHESAKFTTSGTTIGAATAHGKDAFKQETSARIYIDGEVNDDATYHVELNLMKDGKAGANYDGNESYTQRDALREAYVDTQQGDWAIRAGKQQVVWGTADGMKLLDMINPSDYGEMAQNQMEDSRIPVWMVNAEKTNEDGSEFQVVVSQPKENVFAGLNRNINTSSRGNGVLTSAGDTTDVSKAAGTPGQDQGHAFIMKGVDSITGKKNGFVNIVPDLGSVAERFRLEFKSGTGPGSLSGYTSVTVNGFAGMSASAILAATAAGGFAPQADVNNYASILLYASDYGMDGAAILGGFAGAYDTNLNASTNSADFGVVKDSAFEYMGNTTFATFDAMTRAKSQYVYNMPENTDSDIALRYKNTTANGVNYTGNYSYNYDKNPIINLSWRNDAGSELITTRTHNDTYNTTTLKLTDADGGQYGHFGNAGTSAGIPTLRFEQTVKRAHNIGGSFDTAIETAELGPVVIRGEALYQKGVYSPVMDLTALSIGDLPAALTMVKGNRFKYVLGADITALTNMMISAQFIQDRNLDYVDTTSTINDHTLNRFTSDYATMHLTNGFNKAEKDKNFYSLFFSKPFGASGEHRWNNITMYEENGGKWNRFDIDYSIDDDTQATIEYNKYWGDENTQFGQLAASSNIQVGVKYSF